MTSDAQPSPLHPRSFRYRSYRKHSRTATTRVRDGPPNLRTRRSRQSVLSRSDARQGPVGQSRELAISAITVVRRRMSGAKLTAGRVRPMAAARSAPQRAHPRTPSGGCANQNGANRRMRQCKPRRGFGQARRKPFRDQRHQASRALDVNVIALGRADWLRRWARNWITLGRSRQRASGEHSDHLPRRR